MNPADINRIYGTYTGDKRPRPAETAVPDMRAEAAGGRASDSSRVFAHCEPTSKKPGIPGQNEVPLPKTGSAPDRATTARYGRSVRDAAGEALARLEPHDHAGAEALRAYIEALRGECARHRATARRWRGRASEFKVEAERWRGRAEKRSHT